MSADREALSDQSISAPLSILRQMAVQDPVGAAQLIEHARREVAHLKIENERLREAHEAIMRYAARYPGVQVVWGAAAISKSALQTDEQGASDA